MKIGLPRHTPVVLIAAACLLLGSTGGAVAGAMITGKQIKDNTVTTKDIKNGTLAVKDLSKATRKKLAGTAGPAGVTGPAGAAGPRGFSAWDTIPGGVTVSGRFYENAPTTSNPGWVIANVDLPAKAPVAPSGYGFGPDELAFTTPDPACTGTFDAPTAPSGKVCVYMGGVDDIDGLNIKPWESPAHAPHAFYLSAHQSQANASFEFWGSWAYTAP